MSTSLRELSQLADLIRSRNTVEAEIARVIGRPGQIGHVGEYIAAAIFRIELAHSATNKGSDARFTNEQRSLLALFR